MASDNKQEAYNSLSDMASQKGYVTFDDIMDFADSFELSDTDIDWLSSQLAMWGISIYEIPPDQINCDESLDEYSDFAQVDYDTIFSKIMKLEPSLIPLINTIKKIRPPQYKEFTSLIYKAKEGDLKARERVLMMHLRCAIRIGFQRSEMYETDISECISDAFEGLLRAFDKYDPYSSGPFVSYASMWIFQSLSKNQPNQRPIIYYPINKRERYFTVYPVLKNKGCTQCEKRHCCKKIINIICTKLNYSKEKANDIILQTTPLYSYDYLLKSCTNDNSLDRNDAELEEVFINNIADKSTPYFVMEQQNMRAALYAVLKTLSEKEIKTIFARFDLDNTGEKTLEEIGKAFKVTRERIRQIEAKALKKLLAPSRKKILEQILQ